MGKVGAILGVLHKFTPRGQTIALKTLKANKDVLKNNIFGFTELLEGASKSGQIKGLQKELINQKDTVRDAVKHGLESYAGKLNQSVKQDKFFDLIINALEDLNKNYPNKGVELLSENFDTKKQKLVDFVLKYYPNNKKLIKTLQDTVSPEIMYKHIRNMADNIYNYDAAKVESIAKQITPKIQEQKTRVFRNFEVLKESLNTSQKTAEMILDFQKILLKPTNDFRIKNIEKVLKKQYGMQYVHLDNIKDAENILETAKIAVKNNIPVPNAVIVTPYLNHSLKGQNIIGKNGQRMILINPTDDIKTIKDFVKKCKPEKEVKDAYSCYQQTMLMNNYATKNPLHLYLHEFVHSEKPLSYTGKKISKGYQDTIDKLSDYARKMFNQANEEVRTELRTKEILEGLNPDESALLNYLS